MYPILISGTFDITMRNQIIIFFAAFFQDLPAFFLNDSNSTLNLWFGDWNANHWQKKCLIFGEKSWEMTSVNGFKNIILNENTEGILVFIEVNFCWYIVVSIAIKHFQ